MSEIFKEVILEKINTIHVLLAMGTICFLPMAISVCIANKANWKTDKILYFLAASIFMFLMCSLHLFRFYQEIAEEVFVRENGIIQNVKIDENKTFLKNNPIYKIIVTTYIPKGSILLRNKDYSVEREYIVDEEKYTKAKEYIGNNIFNFSNEN